MEVQTAWGTQDINALKRFCTPEMLGYFRDLLNQNTSEGVENRIEDTQVQQVQVTEAWEQDGMEYATALLRWNAIDYTIDLNRKPDEEGYVIEGDPQRTQSIAEAWTFVRHGNSGRWLLSAIQQLA